ALLLKEEGAQLGVDLVWRLLGQEVAAVDRPPADVVSPAPPDVEDVEPAAELVAPGPEREHRAGDPPAGAAVLLVELEVDRRPGAVVLAHGVDRRRVADA